jgi:hypothetical protein
MSTSTLIVSLTTDQLKSLIVDALRDALGGKNLDVAVPSSPVKGKRGSRKPRDPDAPKREPNDWIKFTSRVRSVLAPQMEDGKKVAPKAVTQVASSLKDASLMPSATDDQIIAAYKNWLANPPAVSKMVAEGRDKKSKKGSSSDGSSVASSVKSDAKSAPVVTASDDAAPKKKGRKPMSDDAKKAAAEKRAATNAAKKAASSGGSVTQPAKPSEDASENVMDFEPFTWKKMNLVKNARGDCLTEDMEWFGHYDEKTNKVDTSAPQPADLDL